MFLIYRFVLLITALFQYQIFKPSLILLYLYSYICKPHYFLLVIWTFSLEDDQYISLTIEFFFSIWWIGFIGVDDVFEFVRFLYKAWNVNNIVHQTSIVKCEIWMQKFAWNDAPSNIPLSVVCSGVSYNGIYD